MRFIATTSLERFTYIDREGFVLYDSEVTDPRKLNNHADRPEVLLARHERAEREPFDPGIWSSGVSRRMSATTEVMKSPSAAVALPRAAISRALRTPVTPAQAPARVSR